MHIYNFLNIFQDLRKSFFRSFSASFFVSGLLWSVADKKNIGSRRYGKRGAFLGFFFFLFFSFCVLRWAEKHSLRRYIIFGNIISGLFLFFFRFFFSLKALRKDLLLTMAQSKGQKVYPRHYLATNLAIASSQASSLASSLASSQMTRLCDEANLRKCHLC